MGLAWSRGFLTILTSFERFLNYSAEFLRFLDYYDEFGGDIDYYEEFFVNYKTISNNNMTMKPII